MALEDSRLRDLPRVDALTDEISGMGLSPVEATHVARTAIDLARSEILKGGTPQPTKIATDLTRGVLASRSKRVINATGVILHTNLGRAPLSPSALTEMHAAAKGYTNNEFDTLTASRGNRGMHTEHLLRVLTGAENALVVNNNAGAVLLALSALSVGRSVPVSRGELVEIGGSYRLPDVMSASGASLIEVGTTNKTRIGDYDVALQTYDCALILKVHQANYKISGFVSSVSQSALVDLAQRRGAPFVYDLGSGLLDNTTPWLDDRPEWAGNEPGVRQAIEAGVDLVMFSGDKLLGGPQAGILVGKSDVINILRNHPLSRALRVAAPTDAALAATLLAYTENRTDEIPFWRMATLSPDDLAARAELVANQLNGTVETGYSVIGAGSAPSARLTTPLVRLAGKEKIFEQALKADPPILTRRERGDLLIDIRAVEPDYDPHLIEALRKCL